LILGRWTIHHDLLGADDPKSFFSVP